MPLYSVSPRVKPGPWKTLKAEKMQAKPGRLFHWARLKEAEEVGVCFLALGLTLGLCTSAMSVRMFG